MNEIETSAKRNTLMEDEQNIKPPKVQQWMHAWWCESMVKVCSIWEKMQVIEREEGALEEVLLDLTDAPHW